MRFWVRELAGWVLVLLGLGAFGISIWMLKQHYWIEAGVPSLIGFFVFRGGIHLLKVAVAARPRLPPPTAAGRAAGLPAALLQLQRTRGNRFVQRLINERAAARKCACGWPDAHGGECAECRRARAENHPGAVIRAPRPLSYSRLRSEKERFRVFLMHVIRNALSFGPLRH